MLAYLQTLVHGGADKAQGRAAPLSANGRTVHGSEARMQGGLVLVAGPLSGADECWSGLE